MYACAEARNDLEVGGASHGRCVRRTKGKVLAAKLNKLGLCME
jgi:hypothetical protein